MEQCWQLLREIAATCKDMILVVGFRCCIRMSFNNRHAGVRQWRKFEAIVAKENLATGDVEY